MSERVHMAPEPGLAADEIDMLEALGMDLCLDGDLLVVSFPSTGYREEWIATDVPIERLIGRETLSIGGRRFVLVEARPS